MLMGCGFKGTDRYAVFPLKIYMIDFDICDIRKGGKKIGEGVAF